MANADEVMCMRVLVSPECCVASFAEQRASFAARIV
jgi:hypothetical protein